MSRPLQKAGAWVRRAMVLTTLAGLAAACAGPAATSANPVPSVARTASSAPTASAAASAPASASPTASPTAAPSGLALCATTGTPCPLTAGTYSTAPFIHPFLVTLAGAWTNDRAWPNGGELANPSGRAYLQWGSGFTGGIGPSGKQVTIGATPDAVLAYMQSFKDFAISAPVPVTVGGLAGRSIDVSTKGKRAGGFLAIPQDNYNLAPGEKIRFMVFDVDGAAVVLMVDVPDEKLFAAEVAAMQPVLDSVVWQ